MIKKHILIVDDDISICESLKNNLIDAGYHVTTAGDGQSAEPEFGRADLLVLDLNPSGQDGWDILDRVNGDYPTLRVVVITEFADQFDEQMIPGTSAFLEKPIKIPLLLAIIERLLK